MIKTQMKKKRCPLKFRLHSIKHNHEEASLAFFIITGLDANARCAAIISMLAIRRETSIE